MTVQVLDRNKVFAEFPSTREAIAMLLADYTFEEIARRFVIRDGDALWHPRWVRREVGGTELSQVEWSRR